MKKALFIDRDGTLIREPEDEQIDSLEKLAFVPGVFRNLSGIVRETDHELVMVSNQDGLGTAAYPQENFDRVQEMIVRTFRNEGIAFDAVRVDPTTPAEGASTRKPGTGMLTDYMEGGYDLGASYVIGDRLSDIELARNLGSNGVLLTGDEKMAQQAREQFPEHLVLVAGTWDEIRSFLTKGVRSATVKRTTRETRIQVAARLDSPEPEADISTGIAFFDHMLEQLSRHGEMDLSVRVEGDLEVDEHHTIEDTALALGAAINEALGDKRGIERYGFCLPMDDALAQVAIDLGGRRWMEWDAEFARERIGEMPTEMFPHFFKSFSDGAECNLNIKAEGENEHHKIEAIFKALAKALRMAVRKVPGKQAVPSTKGKMGA